LVNYGTYDRICHWRILSLNFAVSRWKVESWTVDSGRVIAVPHSAWRPNKVDIINKDRMGCSANRDAVTYQCPRWRTLIIVLALCGLTVSLATRTFHVKILPGVGVTSASAEPMRQHLNRDAMQWVAPIPIFTVIAVPTQYPSVAPVAPLLANIPFDAKQSNRPPPSC
jgi:hypothetical protein